jgi:hypothetical protein
MRLPIGVDYVLKDQEQIDKQGKVTPIRAREPRMK